MRNPESSFIQRMHQGGIMPIFFHPDEKTSLELLDLAYESGIRVIEMVNRGKEAPTIFPAIRKRAEQLEGLYLGAGTIYHPHEAEQFVDMGAEFMVSPVMNQKLGEYCQRIDLPWVPGCATLTEIFLAQELGCELAKIYPANVLTPDFIPAVHAVLPRMEIIPTGGVEPTKENMHAWLDAGACCLGMGSQLLNKKLIQDGNFAQLKSTIQNALQILHDYRAQ
ncbi:beta/alpha barrel domain-containing protein [Algoriphagus namhaensis]